MVRFGMAAAVLALMAAPLFAQESTESLKKELEQLRREVDGLKALNTTKEVPSQGKVNADSMAADDNPLMTMFKGTKLSGFVDAGFQFSFNQLNSNTAGGAIRSATGNNPVRVFDNRDNSFYLHEAHLQLERLASKDMIVGYHIELAAGHDVGLYEATTTTDSNGDTTTSGPGVGLQEAWVQIIAPLGSGLDIRVGKMATLCGYEVLENINNMNYSRGMLFGLVIPFTHTGVRMSYGMGGANNDMFVATLGFNNGNNNGDKFADENHGKGVEMQFAVRPIKDLSVALTFNIDNDTLISGSTNDGHYVADLVIAYTMDKLTLALDYAQQAIQGVGGATGPVSGAGTRQRLSALAIYSKYAWTDSLATALRIEYFSDWHGVILPKPALAADSGDGARVFEFSITQEIKIASQLVLRFEIRHDDSNQHNFLRNSTAARGDNTFGVEAIMPF